MKRDDLSDLVMKIYEDRPQIAEIARQQYTGGPEAWDRMIELLSILPEEDEEYE